MSVEAVLGALRETGLARERPLLAMVSGGRDSVCLLDAVVALDGPAGVSALHVNYGLRAEADGDERHCAELCRRLGVELEVVRADAATVPSGQPAGRGNVQAWARELRYGAAQRLLRARGGCYATGHTADDQAETILYRLAASPGRRALLGMSPREGALRRPLLGVAREQTAAYCRQRRLHWREDSSNDEESFARTRVRKGLLPALLAVHPAARENVLRTAALLREETVLLEGLVDAELDGRSEIAVERLGALPAALARMVVVRLAEQAVRGYAPQAGHRVGELVALGRRGGRAELHLGGGAGAVIEDGVLRMVRLPPR